MIKQLLNKLKISVKVLTGKITPIKPEVDCKHEWYGNTYGGFYVNPDLLSSSSIIYSFGIGEDISFDKAILKRHNCSVFGFDPTPKSIDWIKSQNLPLNFSFFGYGIGAKTGFVEFHLPKNKDFVSGSVIRQNNVDSNNFVSVPMKNFTDIIIDTGHIQVDVLKMDIEGSEYDIVESILSSPIKINQVLVELHERFFIDGKHKTKALLKSFKDHGYAVFAVSDSYEEISFINVNYYNKF